MSPNQPSPHSAQSPSIPPSTEGGGESEDTGSSELFDMSSVHHSSSHQSIPQSFPAPTITSENAGIVESEPTEYTIGGQAPLDEYESMDKLSFVLARAEKFAADKRKRELRGDTSRTPALALSHMPATDSSLPIPLSSMGHASSAAVEIVPIWSSPGGVRMSGVAPAYRATPADASTPPANTRRASGATQRRLGEWSGRLICEGLLLGGVGGTIEVECDVATAPSPGNDVYVPTDI